VLTGFFLFSSWYTYRGVQPLLWSGRSYMLLVGRGDVNWVGRVDVN
jgi:hypothetical protein